MKTTKQFSIMMAIVLLSFSINSCKEIEKKDAVEEESNKKELIESEKTTSITITLHVKTDSITQKTVDSTTCSFTYSVIPEDSTYNFEQRGLSLKNYTTLVKLEDEITWEGVSSSSPLTDLVKIKKIKKIKDDNSVNILKDTVMVGETTVFGKVKYGKEKEEEMYSIKFQVFNNGKNRGTYTIDPKLQIGG